MFHQTNKLSSRKEDYYVFFLSFSFLITFYILYLGLYLENKGSEEHSKRRPFFILGTFKEKKHYFRHILRGSLQKIDVLDKCLSCHIVLDIFQIIST